MSEKTPTLPLAGNEIELPTPSYAKESPSEAPAENYSPNEAPA